MRRIISAVSSAALVAAVLVPSIAFASSPMYPKGKGNVANGKAIFENGKGSVPACTSCHGEDGNGNDDMGTPRIAGQFAVFLRKQLEDYATDKRKDETMFVMNDNAKGLSAQDRDDVSTYLESISPGNNGKMNFAGSDLKAIAANGGVVGNAAKGKTLVEWGSRQFDPNPVAACRSCHGYNGRGAPPIYPRIGGQRYVYLVNQLKKWRDGTRTNDPMSQMQIIAQKLSDEDINNAAAYLTNASDYSDGNFQTPYDRNGH